MVVFVVIEIYAFVMVFVLLVVRYLAVGLQNSSNFDQNSKNFEDSSDNH